MNSHPHEPNQADLSSDGEVAQQVLDGERRAPRTNPSSEDGGEEAGLLGLREQLQELRQRFDGTDAQIAGYLRDHSGENTGSTGNGEAMARVQQSLDRLLAKFEAMTPPPSISQEEDQTPADEVGSGHQDILEAIKKLADFQNQLAGKIVSAVAKRMTEELDLLRFQQIVHETLTTEWDRRDAEAEARARQRAEEEALALAESELEIALQDEPEEEEETPPEADPSAEAWSRAIWGPELVASEGFTPFLKELNRRLLAGDAGIATLAGQLLVFRQSPPEAKPQQLKDVGEAYYRTRLDASLPDHPFEQALIHWLQTECERSGLPNTIEVVHVGERFDKSRHSGTTRGGAEVAEVFGWVVLTEGGRVYTRASVAAH